MSHFILFQLIWLNLLRHLGFIRHRQNGGLWTLSDRREPDVSPHLISTTLNPSDSFWMSTHTEVPSGDLTVRPLGNPLLERFAEVMGRAR
jgi:hypothetical protein